MEDKRAEILNVINELPENQLDQLLDYINSLASVSSLNVDAANHLSNIMKEDDNLLKRLAQ